MRACRVRWKPKRNLSHTLNKGKEPGGSLGTKNERRDNKHVTCTYKLVGEKSYLTLYCIVLYKRGNSYLINRETSATASPFERLCLPFDSHKPYYLLCLPCAYLLLLVLSHDPVLLAFSRFGTMARTRGKVNNALQAGLTITTKEHDRVYSSGLSPEEHYMLLLLP